MKFPYKKNNGILKYFYDHENSFYYKILTINSSNYSIQTYKIYNAFDFNPNTYWVDKNNAVDIWFTFCLYTYNITLTGYEITTSDGGNRPTKWTFAVSKDGLNYVQEEEHSKDLSKGETYFVEYKTNEPYQCFRFNHTGLTSTGGYRCDITQIEIFGNVSNLKTCSINNEKTIFITIVLIIVIIINK